MRPGDPFYPIVTVKDSAGAVVTGLVTAGFAVAGTLNNADETLSFTVTEIGTGRYSVNITLPTTAGQVSAFITAAGYTVENGRWWGEIEAQDQDSTYAVVVRPQAQQTAGSGLATDIDITLRAYRYADLTWSIIDQNGAAVDLSGYDNWKFTVRDRNHASINYELTSGVTGSALGVLAVALPEDAAFFSAINAAITAGEDQTDLYYDIIADQAATASKSVHIVGGKVHLRRYEGDAST
jgi:hypothetical protein